MRPHATAELTFEPPPQLSWRPERRLAGRALALWKAASRDGELPAAAEFERGELMCSCADRSTALQAAGGGANVSRVGATIAETFELACGPLADSATPLGRRLRRAFAKLIEVSAPISFEASFVAGRSGGILLTRGVLLPLLDNAGLPTRAVAVMTWKETLSAAASFRLHDELDGSLATGRSALCKTDSRLPGSLFAAFGSSPVCSLADAPVPGNGGYRAASTRVADH